MNKLFILGLSSLCLLSGCSTSPDQAFIQQEIAKTDTYIKLHYVNYLERYVFLEISTEYKGYLIDIEQRTYISQLYVSYDGNYWSHREFATFQDISKGYFFIQEVNVK